MLRDTQNERIHPQFPTLKETEADPELAYSDHVPILTTLPLPGNPVNILSLNILGPSACSGLHKPKQGGWEDEEGLNRRYQRMVDGILRESIAKHDVDVIFLQEANPRFISEHLKRLGEDWEVVEGDTGIISCYNKRRFDLSSNHENKTDRVLSLVLQDKDNENAIIEAHNIWGHFSPFPDYAERVHKECLTHHHPDAVASVVLGDTNSRIAPLHKPHKLRNIATGAVPVVFNEKNGAGPDAQIADYPDGGFYRILRNGHDDNIHQLKTKVLDFKTAEVCKDKRNKNDYPCWVEYRMVMCLDDTFQKQDVKEEDDLNIFSYEQTLRNKFNDNDILVRIAANSFNERKFAVRFSPQSVCYQFVKSLLDKETGFEFKTIQEEQESKDYACIFLPLDKIDQLQDALDRYANLLACQNVRDEILSDIGEKLKNLRKFRLFLIKSSAKLDVLNDLYQGILSAPLTTNRNPNEYYREMIETWEGQKRYKHKKTGEHKTNAAVLGFHRNLFTKNERENVATNTQETMTKVKQKLGS